MFGRDPYRSPPPGFEPDPFPEVRTVDGLMAELGELRRRVDAWRKRVDALEELVADGQDGRVGELVEVLRGWAAECRAAKDVEESLKEILRRPSLAVKP